MDKGVSILFKIAGLVVGLAFLRPDIAYFLKAGSGAYVPFLQAAERGGHALASLSLVLLPVPDLLKKYLGHKFRSALVVLLFAGLSIVLARVLHASLTDGYVFVISQHKIWTSIAGPAAVFLIVAGNWLILFAGMWRVAKVAGE